MSKNAKQEILSCGIKLFKTLGYGKVTIDDICNEAGVTRSAFYYHYKSKEELLDGIYRNADTKFNQDRFIEIMLSTDRVNQLFSILLPQMQYTEDDLGVDLCSWIMTRSMLSNTSAFIPDTSSDITFNAVTHIIELGQSEGIFRNAAAPKDLAWICIQILTFGNTFDWCTNQGEFSLTEHQIKACAAVLDIEPEALDNYMKNR